MKTNMYRVTREIGIDAAHRVPEHNSKCKNLHGHRYRIEAEFECSSLITEGSSNGMGIDFTDIKTIMMDEIDAHCDHATILYKYDLPLLNALVYELSHIKAEDIKQSDVIGFCSNLLDSYRNNDAMHKVFYGSADEGYISGIAAMDVIGVDGAHKLYIVDFIPTAENLAKHWASRLERAIQNTPSLAKADGLRVSRLSVWETPNCRADYIPN